MTLHIRAHFMLWEPFIGPSLKVMRTLLIRPIQGYDKTASLGHPDTWVRKPDCLHLPHSTGGKHKAQGLNPALHLVLDLVSNPRQC